MNELRIAHEDQRRLQAHLFPGDHDEHGAVLLAGRHRRGDGGMLLTVREMHLLGADEFPPGHHGYRQLAASALARLGNRAADENLALVTAHSHPGAGDRNALSPDDLAAHERVFPHLLDITGTGVVGGVAFGERSAAGELWAEDGTRGPLDQVRVIGANIDYLRSRSQVSDYPGEERFDRQLRLFGAAGQSRLRALHVAVLGAGGGGSILAEQLAHLGVGRLTIVDPDVVKTHNLSRIVGAQEGDARHARKKVEVAARNVRRIDPKIEVAAIVGDVAILDVARRLLDCDYMLLATDTHTARLVANAIAQSFLIPLVQIGAKVDANSGGGIEQIYTAVRPVFGRRGCLSCAGLIDPVALAHEAATSQERRNQNYLGDPEVIDPSVTTLNAAAAAGALNVFLMGTIGQAEEELGAHRITLTREGTSLELRVPHLQACRWCGEHTSSRYARADLSLLPLRASTPAWRPVR